MKASLAGVVARISQLSEKILRGPPVGEGIAALQAAQQYSQDHRKEDGGGQIDEGLVHHR